MTTVQSPGFFIQVSKKEVQKINTYCLPVPSSATSFDVPDAAAVVADIVVVDDDEGEEDEDIKSKNLVHFLGMKVRNIRLITHATKRKGMEKYVQYSWKTASVR